MSGKVLMALARDNNGDIVNRGGGGILTPITTTQIETNRPGKFGKSIYTDKNTYFTYTLTEALGTEDFTLSYWAKFCNTPLNPRQSISIGHYDAQIGNSDGHLEQNSTVYVGAYQDQYNFNNVNDGYIGYRYYGYDEHGRVKFTSPFFESKTITTGWHHYVVIRWGTAFLVYCDGKISTKISNKDYTDTYNTSKISANHSFDQITIHIGDDGVNDGTGQRLAQDLDDICLIKGEALFIDKSDPTSSSFSVPDTYLDIRPFIQTKKIFYNFRIGSI